MAGGFAVSPRGTPHQRHKTRLSISPGATFDGVSPSTTRQAQLTTVSLASTTGILSPSIINNDKREKRDRRRSRVLELQQRTLPSPAVNERRKSTTASGLTNNQLADHYASCIKLSAENKINAKNAFGLHLIDYMSELLRKKDSNFQVASSTLDASAKIYAGRVDAIHTETYKVLSGLGRGQANPKDGEDGETLEQDGERTDGLENGEPERKKKRMRASNTIETNLKNINVAKLDLEFEVDPFFQRMSATFDEGGAGGMLLNHLSILDDTSQLVLDSSTLASPLLNTEDLPKRLEMRARSVDLNGFRDLLERMKSADVQICPAFNDFEFTNWNKDQENVVTASHNRMAPSSEHVFDMDAEPEPLPSYDDDVDIPMENMGVEPLEMDDDDDEEEAVSEPVANFEQTAVGDGKEAQFVEHAVSKMTHCMTGNLIQALASEPSDYSYFNSKLLQTWAGPAHWKLKAAAAKDGTIILQGDKLKIVTSKNRREVIVIKYAEEVDISAFKKTRAATMLTKSTLERNSMSQTTLPEDLDYDDDELFRPFTQPVIMIKRQSGAGAGEEEVQGVDYNYNNSKDRNDFCADLETAANDDDDDDDMDEGGGFNFTAASSQDMTHSQPPLADGSVLGLDNLVAQPKKVAKLDIGYAKVAKKVDVKRLKATMWSYLTKPAPTPPPAADDGSGDHGDSDKVKEHENDGPRDTETAQNNEVATGGVAGCHSFSSLVKYLPDKLPHTMASNLSVPIAFVSLLHLANEKHLRIKSDETMSDLVITQD